MFRSVLAAVIVLYQNGGMTDVFRILEARFAGCTQ